MKIASTRILGAGLIIAMLAFFGGNVSGVLAAPNVSGQKISSVASAPAGSTFTYTVNVLNGGDTSATGVTVSDTLNSNLTFVSSTVPASSVTTTSGGQTLVTFNLGTIASSQLSALTMTVRANASTPNGTTITNSAQIAGTNFATISTNTTTTTITQATPVITVSKVPNSSVVGPNGVVTYNITVRNIGGVDAAGVVVTDTLDANTTLVAVSPNPTTSTNNGQITTFNVGPLAAGASFTITTQARVNTNVPVGTTLTNTVGVTGTNFSPVNGTAVVTTVATAPTPTPTPTTSVSPTPVPTGTGTLPRTGADPVEIILVAVALAAAIRWLSHPVLNKS